MYRTIKFKIDVVFWDTEHERIRFGRSSAFESSTTPHSTKGRSVLFWLPVPCCTDDNMYRELVFLDSKYAGFGYLCFFRPHEKSRSLRVWQADILRKAENHVFAVSVSCRLMMTLCNCIENKYILRVNMHSLWFFRLSCGILAFESLTSSHSTTELLMVYIAPVGKTKRRPPLLCCDKLASTRNTYRKSGFRKFVSCCRMEPFDRMWAAKLCCLRMHPPKDLIGQKYSLRPSYKCEATTFCLRCISKGRVRVLTRRYRYFAQSYWGCCKLKFYFSCCT